MNSFKSYLTLGLFLTCLTSLFSQSSISGELRKWHTVTLQFDGPNTSEDSSKNPFLNYRLDVTFTSPTGDTFVVPGFYAADGNAAETSKNSGNKWAARFTPNEIGKWSYNVSFRTGTDIAVNKNPNAGTAIAFDGASGNFSIAKSNKSLPDNRAKGRLNYVGDRYLKFEETDAYFLKAGTDSPENLLAYNDFDNTIAKKTWSPHAADWNAGDPSWQNGKGKELIGAINYLSEKGMNSFSFLTMTINGDGEDVWPYAEASHDRLDNKSGTDALNRQRFDVSKLDQWEILFSHAETKGMYLHFKTQEEENDQLLDDGRLGLQRKLYFRELIARFGHHLSLNWNMGEENTQTIQQKKDCAKFIKGTDPYDHHIVMHTFPHQQVSIYQQLLGNVSEITGPSLQTANIKDIHEDVKKWILKSKQAGKQWVVTNDEQGDHQTGVTVDALYPGLKGILGDNRTDIRHKVLWGTLMAGGAGVEYYFGYQTGVTDLTAEDFRSRKTKWEDAKIALDFFNTYLPFWEMRTNDELTSNSNDFCFAKNGEVYAIYLPNGGSTNINLSSVNGNYTIKWFNPSKGGALVDGSVSAISGGKNRSIGNPPNNAKADWVALVQKTKEANKIIEEEDEACSADFVEKNGLVIIEAENLEAPTGWTRKTTANGFTGKGYLEWTGKDSFNTPGNGTISTTINIATAGTYRFEWRNKIGKGNKTTDFNDSWLRFPDADDFYGQRSNGNRVYPKGSGKSPAPEGASANGWLKVYSSGTTNWTFKSLTSDGIGHAVYVTFENPGNYTMEISGRSKHHLIDRITLNNGGGNSKNLSLKETICEQTETEAIAVTGVKLDFLNKSIGENESFTLKAIVQPINASDKSVTWSTSDSEIAVVNSNGKVSAKKAGTATITATTTDGGFSITAIVTVSSAPTFAVDGITTSPATKNLQEGESFGINATVSPVNAENKAIQWTSTDPTVARVARNGRVTALKAGNAIITATTEDGNFKSSTTVTVSGSGKTRIPVRVVRTNSNIRKVPVGSPFTIQAYIIPSNATNQTVTWSSSNTSIATVDANGVVTPLKRGRVKIIVRSVDGGKESDADITIEGNNNPTGKQAKSLTISPNPATVGSRIHLKGMPKGKYQVQILSFDGSVVATEPADVTNSHYLKFNRLKPGMYIIRVSGIQGVYTGKLVIR